MRFLNLARRHLPVLKNTVYAVLTSVMMTNQAWSTIPAIQEEVAHVLAKRLHRDINVGYSLHKDPVPLSASCLNDQEVFGTTTTIYYGSAVEPSIAVNPVNSRYIVAAWQQDRINNGGALEVGIAYTRNGGKTWGRTVVPFQICLGGISQRISDSWLSYAADGSTVYLVGLFVNATQVTTTLAQQGIAVATSNDNGETWNTPRIVTSSQTYVNEPTGAFPAFDKPSITANPNDACLAYAVWDQFPQNSSFHSATVLSFTNDKGKTFSPPFTIYDPYIDLTTHGLGNGIINDTQTINNIIVVQPEKSHHDSSDDCYQHLTSKSLRLNGDVLDFMTRTYATPNATDLEFITDSFPFQFTLSDIAVIRSQDKGLSFEPNATVVTQLDMNAVIFTGGYTYAPNGQITGGVGTNVRSPQGQLFSVAINPKNGFLYVVWQTGQFRADQLPQIALSTSRDGGRTWSVPVQVNRTPANSPNPQAFTAFVAVNDDGDVGIIYTDFRNDNGLDPTRTLTDCWLDIYKEVKDSTGGNTGVGLQFRKEIRLSGESYIIQNGPNTTQGVMTNADYSFLVTHKDDFYAIYTKSFNGPFTPPILIFNDPANDATVFLDYNLRTSPFVSIIKKPFKNVFPPTDNQMSSD